MSSTGVHTMATGTYDGVRELRSRLPDVPDTIIAFFLSKVSFVLSHVVKQLTVTSVSVV